MSQTSRWARRRQLRAALRQRRRAFKAAKRAAAEAARATPTARRRRLRRRLTLLLLLLLLLLLRCEAPPLEDPAPRPSRASSAPTSVPTSAPTRAPAAPRRVTRPALKPINAKARGRHQGGPPPPPSWLSQLQLQVAARGPRLSRCVEGLDAPGALRWSARLDGGRVFDHQLEPLQGPDLHAEARRCLLRVLSEPDYRLEVEDAAQIPPRLSMIIEF
ncbi:hypothetical protein KKF91_19220 [Myxococcota bacterium]|nr:hypothetical protein [Myxococcota bacterium]MBU1432677.1 hypothetical protein [Myxococcota bacterium]MBU1898302.1 hypothetical protein [Myxococcota bacterium]